MLHLFAIRGEKAFNPKNIVPIVKHSITLLGWFSPSPHTQPLEASTKRMASLKGSKQYNLLLHENVRKSAKKLQLGRRLTFEKGINPEQNNTVSVLKWTAGVHTCAIHNLQDIEPYREYLGESLEGLKDQKTFAI